MWTAKIIAILSSIIMILGALLLLIAESKTLQDTATKLASITGGGLLGLYVLGFMTKRGDGRAVFVGIIFTVLFSTYISLIELKIITKDLFLNWGFSEGISKFLAQPMDTYYAGLTGNIVIFAIAYVLAITFLPGKPRDLKNLTIWTRN